MQDLNNGFNDALQHTRNINCADVFAGELANAGAPMEVAAALMNTTYRLLPLPQGPGAGAQTVNATNVQINTAGAFFNAGPNPNGTVTVTLPNSAGVSTPFTFANLATLDGFLLLHELGHQMGVYGDDVNAAANGTNSALVLNNCFTKNAQGGISVMPRIPAILGRFSLAAGLVAVVPVLGSDQDIRAEIQHSVATPYATGDPDMAAFKLKFAIRLTNRSEKPVNFPRSETGGDETTRVAVLSVESKQPDGAWKYVVQSTWIDDGKIKYEPCTSIPREGIAEIENVPSGLLLLKKQLTDLGGEPTLRFGLWLFCRPPDGKVVITTVMTDAFALRLPAEP